MIVKQRGSPGSIHQSCHKDAYKNFQRLFYPFVRKPISNSTYDGRGIRRGVTIGESIKVFQNTGLFYIWMSEGFWCWRATIWAVHSSNMKYGKKNFDHWVFCLCVSVFCLSYYVYCDLVVSQISFVLMRAGDK